MDATSRQPLSDDDERWAVASLRLDGHGLPVAEFERLVGTLLPTGKATFARDRTARVWIDECPLPDDAPIDDLIGWAVEEAETVFAAPSRELDKCRRELWLGISIPAQFGMCLTADTLRRLSALEVDVIFDLYGES